MSTSVSNQHQKSQGNQQHAHGNNQTKSDKNSISGNNSTNENQQSWKKNSNQPGHQGYNVNRMSSVENSDYYYNAYPTPHTTYAYATADPNTIRGYYVAGGGEIYSATHPAPTPVPATMYTPAPNVSTHYQPAVQPGAIYYSNGTSGEYQSWSQVANASQRKGYEEYYTYANAATPPTPMQQDGKLVEGMHAMNINNEQKYKSDKGSEITMVTANAPTVSAPPVKKQPSWASIASQPAKVPTMTFLGGIKKKGMPPLPVLPGKLKMDLNSWDSKNGNIMKAPVQTPLAPSTPRTAAWAGGPTPLRPPPTLPPNFSVPQGVPPPHVTTVFISTPPPNIQTSQPPPSLIHGPPPSHTAVPPPTTHHAQQMSHPPPQTSNPNTQPQHQVSHHQSSMDQEQNVSSTDDHNERRISFSGAEGDKSPERRSISHPHEEKQPSSQYSSHPPPSTNSRSNCDNVSYRGDNQYAHPPPPPSRDSRDVQRNRRSPPHQQSRESHQHEHQQQNSTLPSQIQQHSRSNYNNNYSQHGQGQHQTSNHAAAGGSQHDDNQHSRHSSENQQYRRGGNQRHSGANQHRYQNRKDYSDYENHHHQHDRSSSSEESHHQTQQQQQRHSNASVELVESDVSTGVNNNSQIITPTLLLEELKVKNNYNPLELNLDLVRTRFFVIKSYSEDDIHRSIKYEIWCSTDHGNKKLDEAFNERQKQDGNIYLFFSVNSSGHFCGVAQMVSAVDYNASSSVWSQDKWKGQFKVKWIYVKDVPNQHLKNIILENNENRPVTYCRDTQEVPYEKGIQVLKIIHHYQHSTSIFDDFEHYEQRQQAEKYLHKNGGANQRAPHEDNYNKEQERHPPHHNKYHHQQHHRSNGYHPHNASSNNNNNAPYHQYNKKNNDDNNMRKQHYNNYQNSDWRDSSISQNRRDNRGGGAYHNNNRRIDDYHTNRNSEYNYAPPPPQRGGYRGRGSGAYYKNTSGHYNNRNNNNWGGDRGDDRDNNNGRDSRDRDHYYGREYRSNYNNKAEGGASRNKNEIENSRESDEEYDYEGEGRNGELTRDGESTLIDL